MQTSSLTAAALLVACLGPAAAAATLRPYDAVVDYAEGSNTLTEGDLGAATDGDLSTGYMVRVEPAATNLLGFNVRFDFDVRRYEVYGITAPYEGMPSRNVFRKARQATGL